MIRFARHATDTIDCDDARRNDQQEASALTQTVPPRRRKVRILATLGPASSGVEMIRKLYLGL